MEKTKLEGNERLKLCDNSIIESMQTLDCKCGIA